MLSLSIHLGNGDGTFQPKPTILMVGSGGVPGTLGVGDFDQDGNDDIVVGRRGISDKALVFWGAGDGTFSNFQNLPVPGEPITVVVEDFDGDTIPDIAIDNSRCCSPGELNVHYSGDPFSRTFTTVNFLDGDIRNASQRWGMAAADFDGDLDLDVVIANLNVAEVSVLFNNGMSSFSTGLTLPIAAEALSVDTGDFNGDGFADIVTVGLPDAMGDTNVSVLLGDGAGGFSAPTPFLVGAGNMWSVRVGDFDGDGILDLSVANDAADSIAILTGASVPGTGLVGPAGDFSTLVQNPDSTFTRTLKNGTRIEFDATGLQTAVIDRNGNSTNYAYDGQGRLTTITDPMGLVTTLAYSGDRLASVTDPALRVTSFVHDANGDLTSITDPDTSLRQFAYDARHRMTSQTSKRNFTTIYDYNFAGRHIQANLPDGSTRKVSPSQTVRLIDPASGAGTEANPAPFTRPAEVLATFTDGNNNVTTFSLDRFGGATEVTDVLGRTKTIERDMNSDPVRIVSPNTAVTELTYDAKGNLLTRTEAVGTPEARTTSFTYEPSFNRVKSFTDAAGKVTIFDYDANGNLLTRTNPLSGTLTFTYNPRGQILTRTDENNNTTTFTYDAKGNIDTFTDAENNVTSFVRDSAGNITIVTEGVGAPEVRISGLTYDIHNRILTVTDGSGVTTQIRYNAAGNVEEIENATGEIQFRSYDELDRITVVDDPVTGVTTRTYDGNGNLIQVVDGRNKATTFEYDAGSRLTKTIDPLLGETVSTYDVMNNLLTLTDPRNQTTSFEYDLLNRVTKLTNPLTQFATFAYDNRNNLITVTDPKTQIITRTYDDLSRLTQVLTPDNQIDLTYDPAGNVLTVADNDSSLAFTYDGLNRHLTADTLLDGVQPAVTLTYAYDAVGNRTTLTESGGAVTQFTHDGAGRLIGLITAANDSITLGHDPAGRLQQILFPNTIVSDLQYDPQGRLVDVTHSVGATPLQSFAYTHDAVSNILSITEPARIRNFAYDDLERLTSGGVAAAPESYSYDAVGNRTASHLSASHVTDAANRLTEDDSFCYAYDANGNLETKTAKVAGACTGGVTAYTWNSQNQLIQITFPDLTTASYRYDGLGRRIEKNVGGVITRYVYDGENILLEFDGTNTLVARYSHGLGSDQPLGVERGGQSFFYQADHQGSVTQITDAGGFVVNAYEYDSYGTIESSIEGIANPFTYTGREFDAESGLYFYRARYYDPETGRFLKEDPIGFAAGDVNLYRYVFNNPVNLTDPDGLQVAIPPPARAGTGLGAGAGVGVIGSPENRRAAKALEKIIKDAFANASENLKNIFGSVIGSEASESSSDDAVPTSPSEGAKCEIDECEEQALQDEAVCRSLKDPAARARCWASANERYGACRAGRPIPPLITS